jgi:hypothetical protein
MVVAKPTIVDEATLAMVAIATVILAGKVWVPVATPPYATIK